MRKEWEPHFKRALSAWFDAAGCHAESGVQVGARELEIDMVVRCDPSARRRLAAISALNFFTDVNLVEVKLMDDRLTVQEFARAMARAWLLCGSDKQLVLSRYQTVAVCSRSPRSLLRWLSEHIGYAKIASGHYSVDVQPAFHILVLRELPTTRRNLRLLLFAPPSKRREALTHMLRLGDAAVIRLAYELYPSEVQEVLSVAKDTIDMDANIRFILEDLGRERILREYTAEERLKGLAPEERLQGLAPEERLQGLPPDERLRGLEPTELLEGLDPDRVEQLRKLLNQPGRNSRSRKQRGRR